MKVFDIPERAIGNFYCIGCGAVVETNKLPGLVMCPACPETAYPVGECSECHTPVLFHESADPKPESDLYHCQKCLAPVS